MKNHFLIFIFCFSFLFSKAQFKMERKINFPAFDSSIIKSKSGYFFDNYSTIIPYSQNTTQTISIKTEVPKLPFFCGMEDKFRNKFNIFLKFRAGNDESYMQMITPATK